MAASGSTASTRQMPVPPVAGTGLGDPKFADFMRNNVSMAPSPVGRTFSASPGPSAPGPRTFAAPAPAPRKRERSSGKGKSAGANKYKSASPKVAPPKEPPKEEHKEKLRGLGEEPKGRRTSKHKTEAAAV
ncbi:hypothetical protein OQA88_6424 [Cercophora sp. LCS_1]